METTDYTHLSDSSIDDILRSIGITVQENLSPQAPTTTSTEEENTSSDASASTDDIELNPFSESSSESNETAEPVHIDTEDILRNFVQANSSVNNSSEENSAAPQTQNSVNLPKIIVKRRYYDNVFMSRFIGAPWAEAATKQQVLVAGMGGIGRIYNNCPFE